MITHPRVQESQNTSFPPEELGVSSAATAAKTVDLEAITLPLTTLRPLDLSRKFFDAKPIAESDGATPPERFENAARSAVATVLLVAQREATNGWAPEIPARISAHEFKARLYFVATLKKGYFGDAARFLEGANTSALRHTWESLASSLHTPQSPGTLTTASLSEATRLLLEGVEGYSVAHYENLHFKATQALRIEKSVPQRTPAAPAKTPEVSLSVKDPLEGVQVSFDVVANWFNGRSLAAAWNEVSDGLIEIHRLNCIRSAVATLYLLASAPDSPTLPARISKLEFRQRVLLATTINHESFEAVAEALGTGSAASLCISFARLREGLGIVGKRELPARDNLPLDLQVALRDLPKKTSQSWMEIFIKIPPVASPEVAAKSPSPLPEVSDEQVLSWFSQSSIRHPSTPLSKEAALELALRISVATLLLIERRGVTDPIDERELNSRIVLAVVCSQRSMVKSAAVLNESPSTLAVVLRLIKAGLGFQQDEEIHRAPVFSAELTVALDKISKLSLTDWLRLYRESFELSHGGHQRSAAGMREILGGIPGMVTPKVRRTSQLKSLRTLGSHDYLSWFSDSPIASSPGTDVHQRFIAAFKSSLATTQLLSTSTVSGRPLAREEFRARVLLVTIIATQSMEEAARKLGFSVEFVQRNITPIFEAIGCLPLEPHLARDQWPLDLQLGLKSFAPKLMEQWREDYEKAGRGR